MLEQIPTNWFSYIFSNPELYAQVIKIIQKPFYINNPKQKEIWNDLEQNVLAKYKYISKSGPLSDKVVYNALHLYMNTHYYPIYGYPNNESSGRSISRVIDIQQLLSLLNVYIHKYVDIGCSEGGITAELGRAIGCGKENVYGIDILPPEKNKHKHLFQYIQVDADSLTLPFENSSVCFVTAIMCLHHIKQANAYIQEVFRILKPGGIFIIQEHNTETENDRIKLDILHGMYCMVWAKQGYQENPSFCEEYVAWYKSKTQWDTLIRNSGFNACAIPNTIKYKAIPRNNVHHNFWAMYQKPRYNVYEDSTGK
jgi:SAM-dependent methyltransferase